MKDPGPCDGALLPGSPAPCRAACPLGTDAAAYVALVAEGRLDEAYDVARAPNPLASICGRICAAPCESACRRGLIDQPIAIRALKRVLAQRHGVEAPETPAARWRRAVPEPIADPSRGSVGIVGAGPAGLSAAHDLRLAGYDVTLYEREAEVGGMLTYGVPSFRLPDQLLQREFRAILDLGISLRTHCEIGRDETLETLLARHDAVLVGVGCQQGRLLETPGVELDGVMRAVDFLRRVRGGSGADLVQSPVAVIGGGSVAFDAARSAWRLQGEQGGHGQAMLDVARSAIRAESIEVALIAPESREQLSVPLDEIEHAEQEGVELLDGLGVRRIVGDERVEGVEVAPVLSLFDSTGAFAPRLDEERSEVIPARTLVLAVGQTADTSFLADTSGIEAASWGGMDADAWGRTSHPRIFAAGDVASGPRDLVEAIASGQRAASAIAHALSGGSPDEAPPRRCIEAPSVAHAPKLHAPHRYWSGYDALARAELPTKPVDDRVTTAEVEEVLAPEAAATEARRCLRCDEQLQLAPTRCVACALCEDVCPYGCLALRVEGGKVGFYFDDDRCIRCGLCVDRCPADALDFALVPR